MTERFPERRRSLDDIAESLDQDHNTSRDSDDTFVASPDEENGSAEQPQHTHTSSVFESTPVKKQNNGTGLVSVGPRPLMLGTIKIASLSPTTPPKSRPSSATSSPAPRSPTSPSIRWSSYTPPLTPLTSGLSPPTSDEVEALKAQLAASEALVKLLMKEKFEAVSASRRLTVDLKNLQDQQTEWCKEKEEILAKLKEVDDEDEEVEVEVAPVSTSPPPSEGAWFAGTIKGPQLKTEGFIPFPKLALNRERSDSHSTAPEGSPNLPELRVSPATSENHSIAELNKSHDTSLDTISGAHSGEDALVRIGSIFLDSGPLDDGCDPTTAPSPVSTPTASYFPTTGRLSPISTEVAASGARNRRWSHQRVSPIDGSRFVPPVVQLATPPSRICLSTSSPRTSINAFASSSYAAPISSLLPPPPRSSCTPPPMRQSPIDWGTLASHVVGKDPCSGYPGRQVLYANVKSLVVRENAFDDARPSMKLATAHDLHVSMNRVSSSTGRPRNASSSPMWLNRNEPRIELFLIDPSRSARSTGPKRRLSFLSLGRAASKRPAMPSALAAVDERGVTSHRSPNSFGIKNSNTPSSSRSPLAGATHHTAEIQRGKNRFSKMLEQGKSFVLRLG